VASFHFDQERALWKLSGELSAKSYRPGAYRSFFIYDPKKRQISAAPYRDRVVHHALVNVLEPIYERTFIHDSYACRKGKGTHAAVNRCQRTRTNGSACTADALTRALRAEGFAPRLPGHVTEATVRTDKATCRRMRCPGCQRRGLEYRPWQQGRCYRVLANCTNCECAEEL
jgi:hypothetical protein